MDRVEFWNDGHDGTKQRERQHSERRSGDLDPRPAFVGSAASDRVMIMYYERDIKRLHHDLAALEKVLDALKEQARHEYIEAYVHDYLEEKESPHDAPSV
jgi:hypothetical protein